MAKSYKVRIKKLQARRNAAGKVTSHRVRWMIDRKEYTNTFKEFAHADGFRSQLVSAQRTGEAFSTVSGLPLSMAQPNAKEISWYDFSCMYVDMKWPKSAVKTRQTIAEALVRVMPAFVPDVPSAPTARELRSALRQWAYVPTRRKSDDLPNDVRQMLEWLARNTTPVSSVHDADVMEALEAAVTRRVDGQPYSASVARKTRTILWNAFDYAVRKGLLSANPFESGEVNWSTMPKGKKRVDRRAVPNPIQARTILNAIRQTKRSGERLELFFALMYFAALRPEEAAALNKRNLSLPSPVWNSEEERFEHGWGTLYLDTAEPYEDARWSDNGNTRQARQLKSRDVGEGRSVPCAPELTAMLYRHMDRFPPDKEGRIIYGEKGGPISKPTYTRAWRAARRVALTAEAQQTPLARVPYDFRHAAVSMWLQSTGDPARVAEWAGHTVAVLHETYAAFLDGGEADALRKVQIALGHRR